jgi:hypothetical protein
VVLIGAKDKRCPRRCRGLQTQVRQTLSMAGVFGGEAIMLTRREAAGHKPSFTARSKFLSRSTCEWQVSGAESEPYSGSIRPRLCRNVQWRVALNAEAAPEVYGVAPAQAAIQ